VDERCSISIFVDLLEVNDELIKVVLRECKNLGTKERDDVIRYHRGRFILKVGIIDTELRVEPVDLVLD
jgi:DNA polymerase II large subunit